MEGEGCGLTRTRYDHVVVCISPWPRAVICGHFPISITRIPDAALPERLDLFDYLFLANPEIMIQIPTESSENLQRIFKESSKNPDPNEKMKTWP